MFSEADKPYEIDEDVLAEENRIENGVTDLIQVQGLRKVYNKKKVAVKKITFGIPRGQVYIHKYIHIYIAISLYSYY